MTPELRKDLVAFVRRTIDFPYPQICKHLVAADLLSLLETHGVSIPKETAQAVVQADDEKAIELLKNLEKA